MVRVLKPGGTLVIACWCQREETPEAPLSAKDRDDLQFLYDEWAHPYFISYQEFERMMQVGPRGRQGRRRLKQAAGPAPRAAFEAGGAGRGEAEPRALGPPAHRAHAAASCCPASGGAAAAIRRGGQLLLLPLALCPS
jgi:hypothetical protein